MVPLLLYAPSSEDGCYLRCRGFIVDSINSASASLSENLPYRTAVPAKSKDPTTANFSHRYAENGRLSAAVRRTLIVDNPYQGGHESLLNICWIDWDEIKTMREDDERLSNLWHAMQDITRSPFWESFDRLRQTNA